jgi:hypothetical protein
MKQDLKINLPSQGDLEKRFQFVDNETLRTNIIIAFRYVSFLVSMEIGYNIPGPILYSIYKDIILYTSTIIESSVHYCIKECINSGNVISSEVMPHEWKDDVCKELYKIEEDKIVYGVVRHKKPDRFTNKTQFKIINKVALKIGIFDEELFLRADKLRTNRNKIHLAGLLKTDDYYEKKDIQEAFDSAKMVIEAVEKKLIDIRPVS